MCKILILHGRGFGAQSLHIAGFVEMQRHAELLPGFDSLRIVGLRGLGREGARCGLEAFTDLKYVCLDTE